MQLSQKRVITDIRNKSAHFLGFEIYAYRHSLLKYVIRGTQVRDDTTGSGARQKITVYKKVLSKVAGQQIVAAPDRKRLLERFHMKGLCNKKGFPIAVPWISYLESFTIVERFNSVIRGICNYYAGFVSDSRLNRWIYILRY